MKGLLINHLSHISLLLGQSSTSIQILWCILLLVLCHMLIYTTCDRQNKRVQSPSMTGNKQQAKDIINYNTDLFILSVSLSACRCWKSGGLIM